MTPQELRRLADVVKNLTWGDDAAGPDYAELEDLRTVAGFLTDTAAVLDDQARIRRRKAATASIEARRQKARADRRARRPGRNRRR